MAKSDFVSPDFFRAILMALTPPNRLALIVSMTTGLRIDDVLSLKTEQLKKQRFTVAEKKTGKRRRIRLSDALWKRLMAQAGDVWVFPGRVRPIAAHRTRQAVFKDLKRAAAAFRLPRDVVLAPHSARKIYAVAEFRRTCDITAVQALLNHSSEAVTYLYAMADVLTQRHLTAKQWEKVSGGNL